MRALCVIWFALAAPLAAQSVTLVSPASMRFSDETNGVSFIYPASWTFSLEQPFYMPLSTTGITPSRPQGNLRGFVFAKTISGVQSWPGTSFVGTEFGYDVRGMASPGDCRGFALTEDNRDGKSEPVTLHGVPFWHATAFSGGMSHGIQEDIYTTFTGSGFTGVCFRFDLAVQSVYASSDTPMRKLTDRENALIHARLSAILDSIHIPETPR